MESTSASVPSNKANFILVLTAPRSLSTIFLRTFLENPQVQVFNDSLLTCKTVDLTNGTGTEYLEQLEKKFDDAINSDKTVVLKDMAVIVQVEYFHIIRQWKQKYNMKFMYLLRHPKPQYVSHEKAIAFEKTRKVFPDEALDSAIKQQVYKPIWDAYSEFNGHIVIAEDIQRNPHHVFKEAFQYADLEFNDRYLQYEKLTEKGLPEDWMFWQHWYTDCITSTGIRTGVTDLSSIVITDESAIKQIAESEEYYFKFVSARDASLQLYESDQVSKAK